MIDNLFVHSAVMEKALDASWLRNTVINNNISNVDTPDFKASDVEFESVFKAAMDESSVSMRVTNEKHMLAGGEGLDIEPKVVQSDSTMRMDGNNVDIEKEEANLAQNAIYYNTLIQKLSEEYSRIRMAIKGGN